MSRRRRQQHSADPPHSGKRDYLNLECVSEAQDRLSVLVSPRDGSLQGATGGVSGHLICRYGINVPRKRARGIAALKTLAKRGLVIHNGEPIERCFNGGSAAGYLRIEISAKA